MEGALHPEQIPALRVEGELERAAVGQYDRMNGIGAHESSLNPPDHNKICRIRRQEIAAVLRIYRERLIDLSATSA